ncbi:MAG: hypothetical protein M1833_003750 [Piccolia ochrophora]|nr:MAG: hypothetical protein M1833_003750 [Piccolia ochrophora]
MPPWVNNPFPSSMGSECKKAGRILASFVDPRQAFGPDKIIPPQVLANAKGLAIITVFKAGFLGSARGGSGVVVARLADGTWSAPSAVATIGGGFGGQIGFELTDFVFILNDASAVRTFAQKGSISFGGNVSIAAGPVGRNAEAAGAASLKSFSGIFSYSKTKGLFAGVSLEGGGLVERADANQKFYGNRMKAEAILSGTVRPPPAADPLLRVLNSRVFAGVAPSTASDDMYNDVPVYDERHDDLVWEGRRGSGFNEGVQRDRTGPPRASTWTDDVYDRSPTSPGSPPARRASVTDEQFFKPKPSRPTAPKPKFTPKSSLGANQARALFNFDAEQPTDLGFKKGDVITIVKRTDSKNDWWTGRVGDKEGMFPSNYVEMG